MASNRKRLARRASRHKLAAHTRGNNRHHPALAQFEKRQRKQQEHNCVTSQRESPATTETTS